MVDAKLAILSVYPLFRYDFTKHDAAQINESRRLELNKEFDSFLETFNLIDLNYEKQIAGGEPSEEILKFIKKATLICLLWALQEGPASAKY
jgi:hypothetical protein